MLDRGPDGVLYRACEGRTGRPVLLRMLPESSPLEESIAAAKRAATLAHPHLAAVLEAGEYRGRAYIVFQNAGDADFTMSDLPLREAVEFVRDAAMAVEYAGGRGFVHPRLQPGCLRLTRKGGATRCLLTGYERVRAPGIPSYEAPEVRTGAAARPASNVYSLGAILYLLTVGRAPSPAPESPEPPCRANPLIPGDVEDLILKAMESDPGRRPGAGVLAAGLTKWLDGQGRPAKVQEPSLKPAWRRAWEEVPARARVPLAAGAGLLVLIAASWMLWGGAGASADTSAIPEPVIEIPPTPKPPRMVLRVLSRPPGAAVAIGSRTWTTPCEMDDRVLPPGRYEIRIESDGFQPAVEAFDLAAEGAIVVIDRELLSETAVTVESVPSKARVSVDGRFLGRTPVTVARKELSGSEPVLRVDLEGYVAWEKKLDPKGSRRELRAVLEPVPVRTAVKIPEPPTPAPAPVPAPPPAPAPAPIPVPPPVPPPPVPSQVGVVQYMHPEYGVFVRLDAGAKVAVGDGLEVVREGVVVAVLKVQKLTRPEPVYPHGAAVCRESGPGAAEGLGVRRAKP